MDAGNIAELDSASGLGRNNAYLAAPINLYAKVGGIFRTMCDRSNISLDDIKRAQAARRQGVGLPPELLRRATSMGSQGEVNPL